MARGQRVQHLVGETVRELGTLILVFAPLESAFAERPLDVDVLVAVIAVGLTLIACGILMEASD